MPGSALPQEMESALRDEYEGYERLLRLSEEQISVLRQADPDIEKAAALMHQKVKLAGELRAIEHGHADLKERWEQEYSVCSDAERQAVARMRDQTVAVIERLLQLENETIEALHACKMEVGRRLNALQQGRHAANAYFTPERQPPRFVDKFK